MIKTIFLSLLFLFGCSPRVEPTQNSINFNQILENQNMTDSDKIIELQIQISKQEDQILRMQNKTNVVSNVFCSPIRFVFLRGCSRNFPRSKSE